MTERWLDELRERLLHRRADLDEVLHRLVDQTTQAVGADRGTLYLLDQARHELVSRVAHLPEISEIRLKVGEGVAGLVASSGAPLRVGRDDPRFSRRIDELTGYATRNLLAVPIRGVDGVIGVLQVLNKREGEFEEADQLRLGRISIDVAELLDVSSLGGALRPGQVQPLAFRFNRIVGESAAMNAVYDRVAKAARTEATVLVRGETGSGKELVARAIHDNSARRDAPFVKVDCAALPESLVENELFGHDAHAFTGAAKAGASGKVQAAHGGTLFLDELGELPLTVQGKLLRLLQDRTYLRVGGQELQTADVRFVAATHRPLEDLVLAGTFRQDLYYRLKVVEIAVPPLRDRGHADIDRLVDYFLYEHSRRHGLPTARLTPEARAALHSWPWPGNVRELEHVVESALVLASGPDIGPDQLPLSALRPAPRGHHDFVSGLVPLADLELAYLRHVLEVCGRNQSEAARRLGIGRNTLARKLSSN